jgi:hypothetical protein
MKKRLYPSGKAEKVFSRKGKGGGGNRKKGGKREKGEGNGKKGGGKEKMVRKTLKSGCSVLPLKK